MAVRWFVHRMLKPPTACAISSQRLPTMDWLSSCYYYHLSQVWHLSQLKLTLVWHSLVSSLVRERIEGLPRDWCHGLWSISRVWVKTYAFWTHQHWLFHLLHTQGRQLTRAACKSCYNSLLANEQIRWVWFCLWPRSIKSFLTCDISHVIGSPGLPRLTFCGWGQRGRSWNKARFGIC
jgi:hypothetical protein